MAIVVVFGVITSLATFLYTERSLFEIEKGDYKEFVFGQVHDTGQIFFFASAEARSFSEQDKVISFLENQNEEDKQEVLDLAVNYNFAGIYLAIYIMDREGNTLVSTDRSFEGNNYSFRDYFQKSILGKPFADVAVGSTSGELGFYFSSPITKGDDILGVAVFKLDPTIVESSFHLIPNRHRVNNVALVDHRGVVVYSDDKDLLYKTVYELDDNIIKGLEERNYYGENGILGKSDYPIDKLFFSDKDTNYMDISDDIGLTSSPILNSPFHLLVEFDQSRISGLAFDFALIFVLFISVFSFSVYYTASRLVNYFVNPVEEITSAVEKASKGDLSQKIVFDSNDELGILANSFNNLISNLKLNKENIEKRIQERTEQLEQVNKSMVGRELKMVELKKEIKKLKEELKKYKE